jgi:hypothetical protein
MKFNIERPLAITMWDFSWLERRWSGAGFEDWNLVLDDLKARGYDAIRIDAYPHLLAVGPEREWTLKPEWNQQVWGAPALTRISNIKNNLIDFVSLCKEKGIMVGLSTWFREDIDNTRMNISFAHDHAKIWINVLGCLEAAGLLDTILYVDLCNEFPLDCWAPFLRKDIKDSDLKNGSYLLGSAELTKWMKDSVEEVRASYPDLNYTYASHVQHTGWQSFTASGTLYGTTGKSLRDEAVQIKLTGNVPSGAVITYQTYVQNMRWQKAVSNGAIAGTIGKSLRLEAFRITLKNLSGYEVKYRAYVQSKGWLPWQTSANCTDISKADIAGTTGKSLRIEAIEVQIVKVN